MKVLFFDNNPRLRNLYWDMLEGNHTLATSPIVGPIQTGLLVRQIRPAVVVFCWYCGGTRLLGAIRQVDQQVPIGILVDDLEEVVSLGGFNWVLQRPASLQQFTWAIEHSEIICSG